MDVWWRQGQADLVKIGHLPDCKINDQQDMNIQSYREDIGNVLGRRTESCHCWRHIYAIEYSVMFGEYEAYAFLIGCHTLVLRPSSWSYQSWKQFPLLVPDLISSVQGLSGSELPPEMIEEVLQKFDSIIPPSNERLLPSRGCFPCMCESHHPGRLVEFYKGSDKVPMNFCGTGMTGPTWSMLRHFAMDTSGSGTSGLFSDDFHKEGKPLRDRPLPRFVHGSPRDQYYLQRVKDRYRMKWNF